MKNTINNCRYKIGDIVIVSQNYNMVQGVIVGAWCDSGTWKYEIKTLYEDIISRSDDYIFKLLK